VLPQIAAIAVGLVAAIGLTPLARRIAVSYAVLDWPDSERKLHARPTPLLGGLAVALAALIGLAAAAMVLALTDLPTRWQWRFLPIGGASALIVLFGLLHDVRPMRGRQRLAVQLAAVGLLCASGFTIHNVNLFGPDIELGLLAVPFTAIWLMVTMNALNLLDGADGVATTIGIVIAATVGTITAIQGQLFESVLAFSLVGALCGFMFFNFPPSTIFLGEAGSTFIGLMVGILASQSHLKRSTAVALVPALALLIIPLLDSSAAIVRRMLTGRGIALSDRGHLHHALMRRGWGPRRLVVGIAGLTLISSAAALVGTLRQNVWYSAAGAGAVVGILLISRAFWVNELVLIVSRTRSFLLSFLPIAPAKTASVRQSFVGLADSSRCQEIWDQLNDFADRHGLSRLRLDLNGTLMMDGHDVLWERVATERTIENWVARIPVTAFNREYGQLQVGGSVQGNTSAHLLGQLSELIEALQPRLEQLLLESTSRDSRGVTRPRVLFLNRSYWPDCEATGQLLTKLCENLADSFDVSVLVGQPNANPKNDQFVRSGMQRRNKVEIHRVRHFRFPKRSTAGRALNLVSFFVSACWQAIWVPHPQVVVAETDPFLLPLLGGVLKQLRGCKLIVYLQDIYPDIAVAVGSTRPGFVTRLLWRMLRRTYNRADQVVVLGNDMRRRLVLRGVDPKRIVCVPNWIDTQDVYPIKDDNDFRRQHHLQDKFVVMHSGNMGLTQELDQLLDVAGRLRHNPRIVFLLLGDGVRRLELERKAQCEQLTNIRFLPYQAYEQLALTLSAADLHVVSMHRSIGGLLVPSKMYGIMASGTPTLAIVPRCSDVHRLVTSERIGFSVRPGDLDQVERLIEECANGCHDLEEMGLRARHLAESRFDFHHSQAAFERILRPICGNGYRRSRLMKKPQPGGPMPTHGAPGITLRPTR
jgi:UDP-GlcNAc:undecaprenyl-phosphate GlcNAc-1-phosphate transferase